jgi:hypothetical protein
MACARSYRLVVKAQNISISLMRGYEAMIATGKFRLQERLDAIFAAVKGLELRYRGPCLVLPVELLRSFTCGISWASDKRGLSLRKTSCRGRGTT